ncbi:hypothetical protein V8C86DRAFT_905231 [Haematococcus lacustris]
MDSDEETGLGRRKPKTETERLIQEALDAAAARKKQKKGGGSGMDAAKPKGKTFAEIEAEEGGPVKESLLGMAQVKRALGRKQREVQATDDTDIPADVDAFEEAAQVEEEDGIKFTGFNLEEEKQTGYFDEEGAYVERKDKDEGERDAWMNSEDAKVVSAEVRLKIEERQRREAEAEAAARRAAPLTDRQIASMKAEMVGHMLAGETLAKALKRLGGGAPIAGRAMGKREKARLQQQQQQQQEKQQSAKAATGHEGTAGGSSGAAAAAAAAGGMGGGTATVAAPGRAEVFERMTELAGLLVEEGEMVSGVRGGLYLY